MLRRGVAFDTVVNSVKEMVKNTVHVFTIADLRWMIRGGRIDPLKGMIGSLLGVKPILDVKDGAMEIIKKVRGIPAAESAVVDIVCERAKTYPEQIIGIAHTDNPGGAARLRDMITKRLGTQKFITCQIGSVLSSHAGIGSLGTFFFGKRLPFFVDIEL
jgi:DegV family protein with EDD domain